MGLVASAYASHQILAEGFGAGYDAPLVMVAEGGDPKPVIEAVRTTSGVADVTPARPGKDGAASVFIAYPKTGAQDEATPELVDKLRDDVIPAASSGRLRVYVGGPNAGSIDFASSVQDRLPVLIAVVVGLFLLLLVALVRSVTIALQAALMNLLSVAAAYEVLTVVVQWGWAGRCWASRPRCRWPPGCR